MPFNSTKNTYADILNKLKEVVEWLKSIGIRLPSTRIASYEKDLSKLLEAIKENKISEFTKNDAFERVANSFYEATQLIDIYTGLSRVPVTPGLKSRLRMLVRGPIASSGEKTNGSSHQPRDYGFELLISSLFAQSGFAIDLDQETDIIAANKSNTYYIECKRPRGLKSFLPSINSAVSQLKIRFDKNVSDSSHLGLIAVSVDLVLHQKQDIIVVPDEKIVELSLKRSIVDLISPNKIRFSKITHPQILGMFFLVQVSIVLQDSNILTKASYLVGYNLVDISSTNGYLFKTILRSIGNSIIKKHSP